MLSAHINTTLSFVLDLSLMSYGIDPKGRGLYQSPLAFDSFDSWLGDDFDYYLDNLFDAVLDDIESDLLTIWSTNRSEQESQQRSA